MATTTINTASSRKSYVGIYWTIGIILAVLIIAWAARIPNSTTTVPSAIDESRVPADSNMNRSTNADKTILQDTTTAPVGN